MEEIKQDGFVLESENWAIKTFFRMFLGLLATALVALYTYESGLYIKIAMGLSYGFLAIIEVVVVLLFSFLFKKLPPIAVTILYFLYATLNGVTMSVIFAAFELNTIFYAFLISASLFGVLAAYGYFTKKDVSRFSYIFTVALIISLIVSIINLIVGNSMVDLILDIVILVIFLLITVFDMNKIKLLNEEADIDPEKLYIYGAMELYLDFINIFIRILSLLGRRRR